MALPVNHPFTQLVVTCVTADLSTPGAAYTRVPYRCKILKLSCVISNAITVANGVVTCSIVPANGTGVNITGGVITVTQAGSGAGFVFTAVPTALNYANEDDSIGFTFTGSTTTCPATFQALVVPA